MAESLTLLSFLSKAGMGSRRRVAEAILQGRVKVNGITAENLRLPVTAGRDVVTLDKERIRATVTKAVYLMLNKPTGVICTTSDEKGRPTVLNLLPGTYQGLQLHPAGRLDKNTTGLLLLTNDGELTYHLTHPKFEHEKEYLFSVNGSLTLQQRRQLENGIQLPEGPTHNATLKEVRKVPPFQYSITIHEGKNRQIRRMLEELGHTVTNLKRVRISTLRLGNLKEREVRELTPQEIATLQSQIR